jgi:hypothetical protein
LNAHHCSAYVKGAWQGIGRVIPKGDCKCTLIELNRLCVAPEHIGTRKSGAVERESDIDRAIFGLIGLRVANGA